MPIISVSFLFGIYFFFQDQTNVTSNEVSQVPVSEIIPEKNNESYGQRDNEKTVSTEISQPESNTSEEEVIIETSPTVQLWNEFQSEARLKLSIHPNYNLQKIDLDDNVMSVYGSSLDGKQKLAVMAAKGNFTIEQIEAFINENKQALKFSNNKVFVAYDKPQVFPGLDGSGISKVTVFRGTEVEGRILNAAYIQRSDNQGSYLLLLESENSYVDNVEGEIDSMYSSLKAE